MKTNMNKSYIVTVLDYSQGEVDIFQIFVPDSDDYDGTIEFLEGVVEDRGHYLQSCHWMFSDPNKFALKVDL